MTSCQRSKLDWAMFFLRLSMGVLFFFAGVGKFQRGYGGFVEYINTTFAETWLPGFSVSIFAHVLPFAELGLGALLILGLFTFPALILTNLLMVNLAFGQILLGEHGTVFNNMAYVAILSAAIALSEFNRISLDFLVLGKGRSDDVGRCPAP